MNQLSNTFTLFLSLLVEAFPFLLMGVILSSLILIFIDEASLVQSLPKNPILGALVGSVIGFLFPVCECGNVPVARRLLLQRIPISVAIGFLLAAPTINPIVIWSTWVAFRDQPQIVWLRILFSLIVAIIVSCIFSVQSDVKVLLQPTLAKQLKYYSKEVNSSSSSGGNDSPLLQSGTFLLSSAGQAVPFQAVATESVPQTKNLRYFLNKFDLKVFLDNMTQELRELGGILVLGSAFAASIQMFTPREVILGLGQSPVTSIFVMMLLAGLISICSTVDAFFALSFASTFTTSSLLAFLVFGPMIDLKSVGLMLSVFKPRIVFYLFLIAAQLIFILTLASYYLSS
ncbi:permease [Euhalothece natronophila Z-M001]|uniref:Permease n=1 Tax=Euhalothece natronophila Z-M001 TaxID=522448 RepID=A0A5B8NSD0_9CHRO|nr:permease [Euhalothece natronophila]QDZ41401.1 permease [Euhalothece natronophila Z-M001]